MSHVLTFAQQVNYDVGQPGITLPVTLSLANETVTIPAKLDTGATNCIFARRYAEQLGIVVERGTPLRFNTPTGSFLSYQHEVTLRVLAYEFDVRVCFAADTEFTRDVLGRLGFLDRIRLGLVDYEGALYLSRYDE